MEWRALRLTVVAISLMLVCFPQSITTAQAFKSEPLAGTCVYYSGHDAGQEGVKNKVNTLLDRLKGLHHNAVCLALPFHIESWNACYVSGPEGLMPNEQQLRLFVEEAHSRGLSVTLKPIMDESMLVGTGHWRGSISPACPEEFFSSYQELIGGLAKQAQALKVDLLIIGSEFNSLEFWTYEDSGGENRSYWSDVIAYMRSVAPSVRLGYSQNWDMLPNAPAWFSELDVLALDAYFPAYGAKSDSSTEAVYAGLAQNRELISDWRAKFPELPLYITEVGISSIGGLYETPYVWGELVNAPVDLESQAIFTAAACQFYSENADGIFWWFTTITLLPDPHNDRGFDYIGKPAEAVIADCNLQFRESS